MTAPDLRGEVESFIALDVSADELHLTAQTVDGIILDDFTLKKGTVK